MSRLASVSGDVMVLTIDRPPVNAMNVELLAEIVRALERVAADPSPAGRSCSPAARACSRPGRT